MLPSVLVRDRVRGDGARVDDVTSWVTRQSPHAIVPDAEAGAGPSYTPLGLDEGFNAGVWELPPLVPRIVIIAVGGGLVAGAATGAYAAQKGRRVAGGAMGAILGSLAGLVLAGVAVHSAILAGERAAVRVRQGATG